MAGDSDEEASPFDAFIEPDSLPVFVEERDGKEFRIAPRFNHGRLRWAVRVNEGSRILYEDVNGLSADAAERFGVDDEMRDRLNDDRKFVHRKFPDLPVKGNRQLLEYPLSDVEAIRETW